MHLPALRYLTTAAESNKRKGDQLAALFGLFLAWRLAKERRQLVAFALVALSSHC